MTNKEPTLTKGSCRTDHDPHLKPHKVANDYELNPDDIENAYIETGADGITKRLIIYWRPGTIVPPGVTFVRKIDGFPLSA